jgi:putative spermidine/putrescine transport system substrate-binding protein
MMRVSRRRLLRAGAAGAASVAVAKVMAPAIGRAQSKQLVVCAPGGSYTEAQRKAIYQPFEKELGVKIIETGPTDYGKLKAMVMSGNVEWDIFDGIDRKHFSAVGEGLLEPLDFQTIDVKDVIPEAVNKHGVGVILSSTVIGYNSKKFSKGNHPRTWAEFWDVKRFPGPRTLQKSPDDNLAFALIADGVAPEKVYPLDLPRAFKSMDRIKNDVNVWWNTGAQSEQIFVNNEVEVGAIWNGRVSIIAQQGVPVAVEWNQGQLHIDYWSIPKGSKNKSLAMDYIAFATQPKVQADLAKLMPYGPVNRKAFEYIDAATAKNLASSPDNIKNQFVADATYWVENYDKVNEAWSSWFVR